MAPHERTVGQRIVWARKRAGLSQDRLAAAVGTTRQVVIRWEKDRHRPNTESREKLAAATGQTAEFFSDDQDAEEDDAVGDWSDFDAILGRRLRAVVERLIREELAAASELA